MNFKKVSLSLFAFVFAFFMFAFVSRANADSNSNLPTVYLFHSETCPHCREEIAFLEELKKEIPELVVKEFEISRNEENRKNFYAISDKLGIANPVVPLTIIGNGYFAGFDKPENSGLIVRRRIDFLKNVEKIDIVDGFLNSNDESVFDNIVDLNNGSGDFKIPFFGTINLKNASLPFLATVLGTLDGFNPCSMWALLVLLTLLINTGSRKKVWLIGGVFIGVSSFSYFLFMTAWLKAFSFLNYLEITRFIIGSVAIVAGVISIKEYFTFKPNICEISTPEQQSNIIERIKRTMALNSLPAIILGVVGIAFSVNLIELMCSVGIPVVFTNTLATYSLPAWKYYFYILWYVFFYMLDDLIVLFVAGFSMKFIGMDSKYSRYSRLVGGILMLALGVIFIVKPDLLMG